MYKLIRSLQSYKPLACGQDFIVLSQGRKLYRANLDLSEIQFLCTLPATRKFDSLPRIRILERCLRLGIESFLILDHSWGLVVRNSNIYRINLFTGECIDELIVPGNRKILALTYVKGGAGTEDQIMFGEYFANNRMCSVNVWTCEVNNFAQWRILFEFPSGTINHVHKIIPAPEMGGVIVLTGDFDHAAGIWLYSIREKKLIPILVGSQEYRATWLYRQNDRYLFATDSQLQPNFLCELIFSNNTASIVKIAGIEGSSIYFGQGENSCFFSSTVEPGVPTGRFLHDVFECKAGPGIQSNFAKIYVFTASGELETINAKEKDRLPLRLGQFGAFLFPSGIMPDRRLYAYGQALKECDDCCLIFERE